MKKNIAILLALTLGVLTNSGTALAECTSTEDTLHWAISRANSDQIGYLIDHSQANITAENDEGYTALHIAAMVKDVKILQRLIQSLSREDHTRVLSLQNKFGATPLHFAAESGNLDGVRYLVEEIGVNINPTDSQKETPLDIVLCKKKQLAANNQDMEEIDKLIAYLKTHGATAREEVAPAREEAASAGYIEYLLTYGIILFTAAAVGVGVVNC